MEVEFSLNSGMIVDGRGHDVETDGEDEMDVGLEVEFADVA